ncbi:MAG: DUF373 family protein [Candidatus Marsarchaeota archaeon]|jgi:putative membrane protein|nr:DUF373 family protein [Candidatus Marsarchaeota archaeon]
MAGSALKIRNREERILVLAVDIDNDLYQKTRISGPLLGKVQNLNGATQLALADPEDSDANTMFQAVKLYDELIEDGLLANVATITGAEGEGYHADIEISRQLELVLEQYKADSCVFVTDGASDDRVLPVVESRIKINSVRQVRMKQAEGLENTYFTILEKLKEPHYARIVFGLPAVLILLFAVSYLLGAGWEPPAALIGLYLLIRGYGLEDSFLNSFRGFGFSIDRMSFVFYLASLIFLIAALFIANNSYITSYKAGGSQNQSLEYAVEGFLILVPLILILYLIGRIIDVRGTQYLFRNFKYGIYIGSSIIFWVLLVSFVSWIIGQIYFSQFLFYTVVAIAIGIGISVFASLLRRRMLRQKRLKDKLVVNELGALIGKVAGINIKAGRFTVNTSFGNPVTYSVDRIIDVSDKVVIK